MQALITANLPPSLESSGCFFAVGGEDALLHRQAVLASNSLLGIRAGSCVCLFFQG